MAVLQVPAVPGTACRRWKRPSSQLQIFGLSGFDRLVCRDADLRVCVNLDELRERPRLVGGLQPWHRGHRIRHALGQPRPGAEPPDQRAPPVPPRRSAA